MRETVRDATFLRDASTFAVAQQNLYIYDGAGVELHCLRDHRPRSTASPSSATTGSSPPSARRATCATSTCRRAPTSPT